MPLVTVDDIRAAQEVLTGVVGTTPLEHSRALGQLAGGDVFLKCENLQRTGSFKLRGAYTRLHALEPAQREAGVVTASAGNHAQGVALAAQLLGIRATVFMPERAPLPKLDATRAYGAEIRPAESLDETFGLAAKFSDQTGAELIHPFDHSAVIAGQGTVGLEILEHLPEVNTVVVPVGGGGLVSGIAIAVKAQRPHARVIGVQAEQAASWPPSLSAGAPVRIPEANTMADGIANLQPGQLTFDHVSALVDDMITVSEEALSQALLLCVERAKLVAEPAGVAAVAALMEHPEKLVSPTVAVVSGGNIDPLLLLQLIRYGMNTSGRFLWVGVRLTDRPGALAGLLRRLGSLEANVIDIEHSRISGALSLGEVDVDVRLETRGAEHREHVIDQLTGAGFTVTVKA